MFFLNFNKIIETGENRVLKEPVQKLLKPPAIKWKIGKHIISE